MPSANIMICLQTWADWKNIPIFYFLYDWLLGLLEDALSPFERPHSITVTAAWQHMLFVAFLCSGIFLVAAFGLTWLLLVYCYKGRTLDCTPSMHLAAYFTYGMHAFAKSAYYYTCRGVLDLKAIQRDVANGQGLCHMPIAACLHIKHVHGTCHYQPRAGQVVAMSALQSLVQAVQSAFLMAPFQPEITFHPCVSNNLLRSTFLTSVQTSCALQDVTHKRRIYLPSIPCTITWAGMEG